MSALDVSPDKIVDELCDEYGVEAHELVAWVARSHSIVMAFDSLVAEHRPADGLPATLASVDDISAVCEAMGMTCTRYGWVLDEISVEADEQGWHIVLRGQGADLDYGYPTGVLTAAVQAARSAS